MAVQKTSGTGSTFGWPFLGIALSPFKGIIPSPGFDPGAVLVLTAVFGPDAFAAALSSLPFLGL